MTIVYSASALFFYFFQTFTCFSKFGFLGNKVMQFRNEIQLAFSLKGKCILQQLQVLIVSICHISIAELSCDQMFQSRVVRTAAFKAIRAKSDMAFKPKASKVSDKTCERVVNWGPPVAVFAAGMSAYALYAANVHPHQLPADEHLDVSAIDASKH
jgi:hypothetical protein